jgi:hypothetical protein
MKPTTMMILMTTILAACHATPVSQTSELAARRTQLIGWLHDYTEDGRYPTDEAGMPQSVFVDARGVRCPMAELIYRSGHPELVEAVAREHNAVRLADVTDGPLHDWMVGSGLTVDEIDLVQGAMDMDMTWLRAERNQVIVASAEVRGRLETAERALKAGTAHSLDVAVVQLPNGKLPAVVVTGKVVPDKALRSGPQFATTAQNPAALRTTSALPRTLETLR